MEFGIHECLPLFAGGLGILAGDHLKAASDLMLPLTGVGLLYRQGYFRQFLNRDGMQQEEYPEVDLYTFPVERALDLSGQELFININGPNGGIRAQVWKLMVGRASLFLIDTNIPDNPPEVRDITANLYPANQYKRLGAGSCSRNRRNARSIGYGDLSFRNSYERRTLHFCRH